MAAALLKSFLAIAAVIRVITLFITPVIYLYLDRYSGKGPITRPARDLEPAHGD